MQVKKYIGLPDSDTGLRQVRIDIGENVGEEMLKNVKTEIQMKYFRKVDR
jgi:hypothetical protein